MEDKYYEPEIEEFHVGFEYEIFEDWDYYPEKEWHKQVYGLDGDNQENIGYVSSPMDRFRVKYLDREDIESFGFVKSSGDRDFEYPNKHYQLEILKNDLIYITSNYGVTTLFSGIIKNKSELKRILKQIGV
jgi:hypothetical protein